MVQQAASRHGLWKASAPLGKPAGFHELSEQGESVCITRVNSVIVFVSPTFTHQQEISLAIAQKKSQSALWYIQLIAL